MKKQWSIPAVFVVLVVSAVIAAAQSESAPAAPGSGKDVATLTMVSVHPDKESISVEITCSRPITPTPTMITDPSRLVLDFADTISANLQNRINVNQDGLKSVRIGVQPVDPPTTRVVLDLEQERSYQLLAEGNKLTVKLGQEQAPGTPLESGAATGEQATSAAPDPVSAAGATEQSPTQTPAPSTSLAPQASAATPAVNSSASRQDATASSESKPAAMDNAGSAESAAAAQTEKNDSSNAAAAPASVPADSTPSESKSPSPASEPTAKPAVQANPGASPVVPSPAVQNDPRPTVDSSVAATKAAPTADPTSAASASAAPLSLSGAKIAPDVPSPAVTPKAPAVQALPGDYVIGEQDVLSIVVWKERELSATVVVRPDGKITLPLINEIKVVGMTPAQLQEVLTEKFKPFLNVPQVTVEVVTISSRKAYLIGEVMKTGTFPLNSSTTVLQIIAEAGGLRDFAKRKDIYILRTQGGKQVRYRFNYDEVIRGKNTQQNIILQPGDMIVVP